MTGIDRQPRWARVAYARVRHGGRSGETIGYVWFAEGRPHFAYSPAWCLSPHAYALDPVNLPLTGTVYSDIDFRGALSGFSARTGGYSSRRICLALMRDIVRRAGVSRDNEKLKIPDALTLLCWFSITGMSAIGGDPLYFEPEPSVSNSEMSMWLPTHLVPQGDHWFRVVEVAESISRQPLTSIFVNVMMGISSNQAIEALWLPTLRWAGVSTGDALSLRHDIGDKAGMFRINPSDSNIEWLRIRRAYLRLAEACGINTAPTHLLEHAGRHMMWTGLAPQPVVTMRWKRSTPFDDPAFELPNPDCWLWETERPGCYIGRSAWRSYYELIRAMRTVDADFDYDECFRRLVFAVMCGTLCKDTSPLAIHCGVAAGDEANLIGRPTPRYRMAPATSFRPWLLPYKTALTMRRRIVKQAMALGRLCGFSADDTLSNVERVITGFPQWPSIAKSTGLNDHDADGTRPVAATPRPPQNAGSATSKSYLAHLAKSKPGSGPSIPDHLIGELQ